MAKTRMIEVFRAGKQTDSAGHTQEWTEADLDKMVTATEAIGEDVAWTIGHPESDTAPAFAWSSKWIRKGKSLYAEMKDITSELADMLKKKMFKNRSIALRPDLSLQHIALLGAAPPAVKGLAAMGFKSGDDIKLFNECFEDDNNFAEDNMKTKIINAFKSWISSTPEGNLEKLFNEKPSNKGDQEMDVKELETKFEAKFSEMNTQIEAVKSENEALKTENKTLKEDNEKSAKEFAEYKTNQKRAAFGEWFDKQVEAGRELPANKEATVSTMMILDGRETMDFAEGDETIKKTPLDIFKAKIEASENGVEFSEVARKEKAEAKTSSETIKKFNEMIAEKQKDGKSYSNAFSEVASENPDLAKKVQRLSWVQETRD